MWGFELKSSVLPVVKGGGDQSDATRHKRGFIWISFWDWQCLIYLSFQASSFRTAKAEDDVNYIYCGERYCLTRMNPFACVASYLFMLFFYRDRGQFTDWPWSRPGTWKRCRPIQSSLLWASPILSKSRWVSAASCHFHVINTVY